MNTFTGVFCLSLHPPFRKILRLVKHTLASVSGVRDQEMALLDEMLAACAREASNKSLELIFSSHLFYQNRQERFISSLAGKVHHTQVSSRLRATARYSSAEQLTSGLALR